MWVKVFSKQQSEFYACLKYLKKISYTIGLLPRTEFTAYQTAGCGSVQPLDKKATFTDCSEEKGAYCTSLSPGKYLLEKYLQILDILFIYT